MRQPLYSWSQRQHNHARPRRPEKLMKLNQTQRPLMRTSRATASKLRKITTVSLNQSFALPQFTLETLFDQQTCTAFWSDAMVTIHVFELLYPDLQKCRVAFVCKRGRTTPVSNLFANVNYRIDVRLRFFTDPKRNLFTLHLSRQGPCRFKWVPRLTSLANAYTRQENVSSSGKIEWFLWHY